MLFVSLGVLELSRKEIFTGLGVFVLLGVLASLHTHIKPIPQLILFFYAVVTVVAMQKFKKAGLALFYILLGVALFILFILLIEGILDLVNPNRNYAIDKDLHKKGLMNMGLYFLSSPIAIILSAIALRLYHKKLKQSLKLEQIGVALYSIAAAIIYFVNEV